MDESCLGILCTHQGIAGEASDALSDGTGQLLQIGVLRNGGDDAAHGTSNGWVKQAGDLAALEANDRSSRAALHWGSGHNAGGEEGSEAAEGYHFE